MAEVSDGGPDGVHGEGETVEAAVTFSAVVNVGTGEGTQTLGLIADGTLGAIRVAAGGLKLNGGAIAGAADGMPAVLSFGDTPGVTGGRSQTRRTGASTRATRWR